MPRLFIGIGLPDTYRQSLNALTKWLSKLTDASVNWSRPDTWHLTLKFLGETEEARIPAIREALAAIHFPAFPVQAGGTGAFPDAKRPKVLWLGLVQGGEQTATLARSIEDALTAIGIPREKKPFRPHLTLGRIRKPAPGDWQPILDAAAAQEWPPFTVPHFTLWQSVLTPEGAIHTPLAAFPAQQVQPPL
ncbi:2'-5' RNA ligase [Pseudodesulfovibrio mercurii]|uniref:RNA 2',3'-cyclic phosphodiesterase n=1 Tax=Pseudodesulfovibrio mercurii TaxID=641491 RepID=F0JGE5_9BACT|nr:RNA 2',3'-cyclic phosphodiesterase [Pseudodesulfovibrio mercurii]EGB15062.1 2'-5' RNA ligase [Pseudodesulfovibrio mercurii]